MIALIIFGTKGVTKTVQSGTFFCPACQRQSSYNHKKVMRYFTLYWIPIFPVSTVGEYIECSTCRGTFKPHVLGYNQGQMRA